MNKPSNSGVSVTLRQCAKTFRHAGAEQRVLQPLDLEIQSGETVVLLGPSGCGKTTTLRIIAGLESPDAGGQVLYGTRDVTQLPIEQRNVGMVFQSYALFPNLNVRGNVEYGLKIRRMPVAERTKRVDEMLEMTELGALAERRIDQLSGGQRQRVALARAIATRPQVLLLDEPLTALDARLRETLRGDISRLLRSLGVTAVYVTHDQAEAMALGDRIAVMDHGVLAQIGTPQQIYFEPANAFVAEFIGTHNMVTIDGKACTFRPEDVSLSAADHAVDGAKASDHDLRGIVSTAVFLGDHQRVTVDVGQPRPVVVRAPARSPFVAGDEVALSIAQASAEAAPC
jgi:putative spermidine/putrescine transport system ATP-binding protein